MCRQRSPDSQARPERRPSPVQDQETRNGSAAIARWRSSFQSPLLIPLLSFSFKKIPSTVIQNPLRIVIPKRGLSREESAVSPPAASSFLADRTRLRNDKLSGLSCANFTTPEHSEPLAPRSEPLSRAFLDSSANESISHKRVSGKRQMRASPVSNGPSPPESGSQLREVSLSACSPFWEV